MQTQVTASVEVSGPCGQKQTNNFLLKNKPSSLNPNTKLILEDNLFSSPYASFAWYIGRSTTQAVGH